MDRRTFLAAAATGAATAVAAPAIAQNARPIMLIGPFAPGGSNDAIPRIFAQKVATIVGRPVLVDNKPGAGGLIAAQHVARSAPDGSTLLIVSNTFLIAPHVYKSAGYDAVRDFTPVTPLYATGVTLVARGDSPLKSLGDLVEAARRNPAKLTYATNGVGTFSHLQMEMFKQRNGIDITHIPYRSLPEGSAAVMSGLVDVAVDTPFGVAARVRGGQLRPLVIFGFHREESLPDVPTNTEAGFPDPDQQLVFAGLVAPAKTPAPMLQTLREASLQATKDTEYLTRLKGSGVQPFTVGIDRFGDLMKNYSAKYRDLVAALNVSLT